jgi:aspartyl-tRNA(Asn)/glutamyl-tRNA(Gln) amidotransferase subunit C
MKITDRKIAELAHLCRLEFEGEKKENIKADLDKILDFCEQLNKLDTDNIEPLIYMTDNTNDLRDDVVVSDISKEDALKNAPSKDSDYFRVPKVIDKS